MAGAGNPRELLAQLGEQLKQLADQAKQANAQASIELAGQARATLADLREAVLEQREEHEALRQRVATLEEAARVRPTLVRHKGVYWLRGDSEPWCPTCWEKDQVALHLNRTDLLAGRLCACPRCNYNVNLDNTSPPKDWLE